MRRLRAHVSPAPRRAARGSAWRTAVIGASLALAFAARPTAAEESPVPIALEVELMLKVASYDKNFATRAGSRARLLVLVKPDDADSERAGAQALKALADADPIAGVPIDSARAVFVDAAALARQTVSEGAAIVYVTPGFTPRELAEIGSALEGISVLSVGSLAKYTAQGTVLGFDLAGGKPKLLVHLARAKKQRVELASSVLKLMRVVE